MRIKNLLLLAAFLTTSGVAMAQTTITAGNVKFLPADNGAASMTYYYTNTEAMGGFQMLVSLPEGVTLEQDAAKIAKGLSINGGEPAKDAVFYNVEVPDGFECIGGQTESGDILLVCFPVKAGVAFKATSTPSQLCKLTLTASDESAANALKSVSIKEFVGSDTQGTGGAEAAAKYAMSTESSVVPVKVLTPDVNLDKKVNGTDIQAVINLIVDEDDDVSGDVNKDNKVNGTDIQEIINIIVDEE